MQQRLALALMAVVAFIALGGALGDFTLADSRLGEYLTEFADAVGLEWLGPILPAFLSLGAVGLPLAVIYYLQRRGFFGRQTVASAPALERNNEGIALFDRGAYQAAVAEFTEAIRLDRKLGVAYYNRANAYLSLDRLDEAGADFAAALPLMKARSKVHAGIGYLWAVRGNYDCALAECETALQLDSANGVAYTSRGHLFLAKGEVDRALADFDRALFYTPRLAKAYSGRTLARMVQGRWDDALQDVEQALSYGGDAGDLLLRGRIWMERQDYDRAIADFSAAISAGHNEAAAYRDRGLAWLMKGNCDQAIADANQALAREPKDAIAWNNRGTAYLRSGAHEKALADLRQAEQLDPKLPNIYKNLAWLQATCPRPEFRDGAQAVANAMRALEMVEWKAADWLPILAAAHAEAGQFEEAVRKQTKYLDQAPQWSKADAQARLELYQAGKPYRDEGK